MDMFEFILQMIGLIFTATVVWVVLETILIKWLTHRDLKKFNEKHNQK